MSARQRRPVRRRTSEANAGSSERMNLMLSTVGFVRAVVSVFMPFLVRIGWHLTVALWSSMLAFFSVACVCLPEPPLPLSAPRCTRRAAVLTRRLSASPLPCPRCRRSMRLPCVSCSSRVAPPRRCSVRCRRSPPSAVRSCWCRGLSALLSGLGAVPSFSESCETEPECLPVSVSSALCGWRLREGRQAGVGGSGGRAVAAAQVGRPDVAAVCRPGTGCSSAVCPRGPAAFPPRRRLPRAHPSPRRRWVPATHRCDARRGDAEAR